MLPARHQEGLPELIDRTSRMLAAARSAAELLEARDIAGFAYDAAKKAARLAKAKQAHDDLIAAAYRTMADALELDAGAKRRLADEYDAAQERGEVAKNGGERGNQYASVPKENTATAADIGLTRKEIHEARIIRDAEVSEPGIVRRTIDDAIAAGKEPSKAKVRRAALQAARPHKAAPARADNAPRPPRRGKERICQIVVEALSALSGLPTAREVKQFFEGSDGALIVAERLGPAAAWLAEFSEAWRESEC